MEELPVAALLASQHPALPMEPLQDLPDFHEREAAILRDRVNPPNDRSERQQPRRDDAADVRQPERAAEVHDSRTAKRGGCSLQ